MSDLPTGLYYKYEIRRVDGQPVEWAFVLEPAKDEHAYPALFAYADSIETENPQLAADIRVMVENLKNAT